MAKEFESWAIPIDHLPEHSPRPTAPVVRRKERPLVRFLNEVYPHLFTIALLGLWLLFSLFKLAISLLFRLLDIRRQLLSRVVKKKAKKHVVVIGGGYAGTFAASAMEHDFKVTMIEPKDFFEFTPSRLRSIVEPNHTARIQVEHRSILTKAKIIHDKVVRVADGEVFTERGAAALPYDYLVIASGSRYPDPHFPRSADAAHPQRTATRSVERSNSIGSGSLGGASVRSTSSSKFGYTMIEQLSTPVLGDEYYDDESSGALGEQLGDDIVLSARAVYFGSFYRQIRRANSILVIGGGTVGVEMAAEIREHFPTKEVIIINSPDHLLKNMPPRSIRYAEQWFRQNNVEMILGDRVVSQDGKVFRTRTGREIRADLAFLCTGNVPNSEFLTCGGLPVDPEKLVNPRNGLVRVNEFLQLQGYDNIFVAGDLTDVPSVQEKLCQTAALEIKVVMANICRLEQNRMLKRYRPKDCPMLISLGKYDGMLVYKNFTMTGFLPAVMKEFVEWKELVWYWSWSYFKPSHFRKTSLMDVGAPLPHAHVV